jgi:hypothetical protein
MHHEEGQIRPDKRPVEAQVQEELGGGDCTLTEESLITLIYCPVIDGGL